jgi:hypothetical protein
MLTGCATTIPMSDMQSVSEVGAYQSNVMSKTIEKPVSILEKTPKPPDWVLGREHNSFHQTKYLVGVGFSNKNTVSASESARAELTKNIRFKIQSLMKDYNSNDGSFVETFVKTETDFLLEGVQIKDGWYDPLKKVYYSFAVVKRKDVLTMIQDQIDELVVGIVLVMKQADKFYNDGNVIKSLVYYYDGYNESSKLLPLLRTYKTVNSFPEVPSLSKDVPSANDFKEKVQSIIGGIDVEKINDNYTTISLEKDVSFEVKITYNGKPIKDLPVKFHGNSYNFLSKTISDANGICRVTTNGSTILNDENFAIVEAEIDLRRLSKRFNYKLKKDLFGRLETLDVTFKRFKPVSFKFSLKDDEIEVGKSIVFFVKSDMPGYLVIKSPTEKIFPNYIMRDNYIQRNKMYNIGGTGYEFKFLVKPPLGQESVTAVLYKESNLKTILEEQTIDYMIMKGE